MEEHDDVKAPYFKYRGWKRTRMALELPVDGVMFIFATTLLVEGGHGRLGYALAVGMASVAFISIPLALWTPNHREWEREHAELERAITEHEEESVTDVIFAKGGSYLPSGTADAIEDADRGTGYVTSAEPLAGERPYSTLADVNESVERIKAAREAYEARRALRNDPR